MNKVERSFFSYCLFTPCFLLKLIIKKTKNWTFKKSEKLLLEILARIFLVPKERKTLPENPFAVYFQLIFLTAIKPFFAKLPIASFLAVFLSTTFKMQKIIQHYKHQNASLHRNLDIENLPKVPLVFIFCLDSNSLSSKKYQLEFFHQHFKRVFPFSKDEWNTMRLSEVLHWSPRCLNCRSKGQNRCWPFPISNSYFRGNYWVRVLPSVLRLIIL